MPAVQTQQLAVIADLDTGPDTSAMVQALAMYTDAQKNIYLRRASGTVLAAYGARFGRTAGESFRLAKWGDLTIGLVIAVARWEMISDRGYNEKAPADAAIRKRFEDVKEALAQIVDLKAKAPNFDPDAEDESPAIGENGPLASTRTSPFWQVREES